MDSRYMLAPNERLFPITKSFLSHEMERGCKNTGVKRIRIHDIRHSHASLLINQGCDALILADRLGHEKVSTTLNTYSHLFPHKQQELVSNLEQLAATVGVTPTPEPPMVFFASTFWTKLQNIFGHYCKSKLEKVAKPRLAAILPAA